ncbi:hypothetical protein ILUMI_08750 [Ignelater luminosus]|uniref:Small-subunit processome Utp12 domain-containing protein n=1 Tax=Ignelater luminosus TaxID=2038154 RepID=A0A8K0D3T2_IGNLU|nr:hypothetical protein ILUMI_08750 [Ignelater luminosus]
MAVGSTMASQFSKDGKYFAQFSNDGKLKIWETSTSTFEQEFTPDFHLTSPCTCLHFIQQDSDSKQNHSPRKKKRRESLNVTAPFVALGTSSGLLLLYSISRANLDFTIDSETNQSISCLSWNDGTILYSAIDQNIVSWNLDKRTIRSKWKAGNEKLSSILVVPDSNKILTASRNIKLWDIDRKEVLKTYTGHSYEVSLLQYARNTTDAYIISGSKGDRLLSVWNLSEKSKDKNAVASFLMEDVPSNISVVTEGGVSNLIAITRSGVAHFYQHTLNGKCNKPIKPKTTLQIASDVGHSNAVVVPIPIVSVFLHQDLSLTIGHGSEIVLSFENVVLNECEKVQCLIRKDPRVTVEAKDKKVTKIRTPAVDSNVHYVTPHTSSSTGTAKRKGDGSQEVPMEKRLENLQLNKLDSTSKVPKVDNVAQLLVQGLHSKDKAILRSVLNRHDEKVIKNTIKRLPMPVIIPFVQEVTGMIQGKTVSSQIGTLWLKNLLQVHAGLLLSNPELPDLLGPVLGTIESRLSLLTPLNRLRGRLDLLVSQVGASNSQNTEQTEDDALLIYNDKESSDSESEDMDIAPQSESDNEWVEESSDNDGDENNEQDEDSNDDIEML